MPAGCAVQGELSIHDSSRLGEEDRSTPGIDKGSAAEQSRVQCPVRIKPGGNRISTSTPRRQTRAWEQMQARRELISHGKSRRNCRCCTIRLDA